MAGIGGRASADIVKLITIANLARGIVKAYEKKLKLAAWR